MELGCSHFPLSVSLLPSDCLYAGGRGSGTGLGRVFILFIRKNGSSLPVFTHYPFLTKLVHLVTYCRFFILILQMRT